MPRDLLSSNTDRIPWGQWPVLTQSLGMERLLSSGRRFYLDNSTTIKHLGGRALTCQCHSPTAQLGHADMPQVSRQACSRPLSSLPGLCHLSGTSTCETASGLWQPPHLPRAMWVHIFWSGSLLGVTCVLALHGSIQWWAKAGDIAKMVCAPTPQQLHNPSCSHLAVCIFKVFWLDTISLCIPTAMVQCPMAMRLLCSATMPRTTTVPTHCQASLKGLESSRSGWWQPPPAPLSLSPSCWGRTCCPQRLSWDKAWLARPSAGLGPTLSGRSDCGSPEDPSNTHFYGLIVYWPLAPSKANAAVKPALISTALSIPVRLGYLWSPRFPLKWVPLLKKFLLEFRHNIRLEHTLVRCFWNSYPVHQPWILTFLIC